MDIRVRVAGRASRHLRPASDTSSTVHPRPPDGRPPSEPGQASSPPPDRVGSAQGGRQTPLQPLSPGAVASVRRRGGSGSASSGDDAVGGDGARIEAEGSRAAAKDESPPSLRVPASSDGSDSVPASPSVEARAVEAAARVLGTRGSRMSAPSRAAPVRPASGRSRSPTGNGEVSLEGVPPGMGGGVELDAPPGEVGVRGSHGTLLSRRRSNTNGLLEDARRRALEEVSGALGSIRRDGAGTLPRPPSGRAPAGPRVNDARAAVADALGRAEAAFRSALEGLAVEAERRLVLEKENAERSGRDLVRAATERLGRLQEVRAARLKAKELELEGRAREARDRAEQRVQSHETAAREARDRAREAAAKSRRAEEAAAAANAEADAARKRAGAARAEADRLREALSRAESRVQQAEKRAERAEADRQTAGPAAVQEAQQEWEEERTRLREELQAAREAREVAEQAAATARDHDDERATAERTALERATKAEAEARKLRGRVGDLEQRMHGAGLEIPPRGAGVEPTDLERALEDLKTRMEAERDEMLREALERAHEEAVKLGEQWQEYHEAAMESASKEHSETEQQRIQEALTLAKTEAQTALEEAVEKAREETKAQFQDAIESTRKEVDESKEAEVEERVAAARAEYEAVMARWEKETEKWRQETVASCEASLAAARKQVSEAKDAAQRARMREQSLSSKVQTLTKSLEDLRQERDELSAKVQTLQASEEKLQLQLQLHQTNLLKQPSATAKVEPKTSKYSAPSSPSVRETLRQSFHQSVRVDTSAPEDTPFSGSGPPTKPLPSPSRSPAAAAAAARAAAQRVFARGPRADSTDVEKDEKPVAPRQEPLHASPIPKDSDPPSKDTIHQHFPQPSSSPPPTDSKQSPSATPTPATTSKPTTSKEDEEEEQEEKRTTSPSKFDRPPPLPKHQKERNKSPTKSTTPEEDSSSASSDPAGSSPLLSKRLRATVDRMPVAQLRALLDRAKIPHDDCLEKEELRARLLKAVERGAALRAGGTTSSGGVTSSTTASSSTTSSVPEPKSSAPPPHASPGLREQSLDEAAAAAATTTATATASTTTTHATATTKHSNPSSNEPLQHAIPPPKFASKPPPESPPISASEALSNWLEAQTDAGEVYYYHRITRAVRWELPDPETARHVEFRIREEHSRKQQRQAERIAERAREVAQQQHEVAVRNAVGSHLSARVQTWSTGRSVRSLLASLHEVVPWASVPDTVARLAREGTQESIKKSYLRAIRIVHPDKVASAPIERRLEAQHVFSALQEAWERYNASPTSSSGSRGRTRRDPRAAAAAAAAGRPFRRPSPGYARSTESSASTTSSSYAGGYGYRRSVPATRHK